jgi:hypothetical protein
VCDLMDYWPDQRDQYIDYKFCKNDHMQNCKNHMQKWKMQNFENDLYALYLILFDKVYNILNLIIYYDLKSDCKIRCHGRLSTSIRDYHRNSKYGSECNKCMKQTIRHIIMWYLVHYSCRKFWKIKTLCKLWYTPAKSFFFS